jgi:hypothetical protein
MAQLDFHLHSPPFPVSSGWGEMPSVHSKAENSWGEPSSPCTLVDNGTAAWGKPPSSGSGWDHPAEPVVPFGRASAPAAAPALCKPGMPTCLGLAPKTWFTGWRSRSVRKVICCVSIRTRVQLSSADIRSQPWLHVPATPSIGGQKQVHPRSSLAN